ncbi:lipopolysaccharide transport periplasmic protein LptA [Piscinibacter sakaiensis]|uniref:lipopolysaccharide transport periplasmic protein LptA n=1 Tax=Piscinibacter sakaiensis TaxID=1547922 RepID=UPI003AAEBBA1
MSLIRPPFSLLAAPLLLLVGLASTPASAERADRGKPLEVVADTQGSIDVLKQVVAFSGNVVITKGTLTIKADRVEVREGPNGFRTAIAIGSTQPATFRQKRDGVDEYIEGNAARLEYDERGEVVRFINNASVRRLQGRSVAEEITGELITYDGTSEVFTVSGGTSRNAAGGNGGRVRAVLTPRPGSEAAAAAANDGAAPRPDSGARR